MPGCASCPPRHSRRHVRVAGRHSACRGGAPGAAALPGRGRRRHRDRRPSSPRSGCSCSPPAASSPVGPPGWPCCWRTTVGWPFAATFLVVSLPFVALAIRGKGWAFTLRSAAALAMVSVFSALQPHALGALHIEPLYASLVGNLLAGVGILMVFRHRSSLGGFNVVALLCQERLGWRAGYVQMGLDLVVVLAFAAVSDLRLALASPRRAGPAEPRHRHEPPARAVHRWLSRCAESGGRMTRTGEGCRLPLRHVPQHPTAEQLRAPRHDGRGAGRRPAVRAQGERHDQAVGREPGGVRPGRRGGRPRDRPPARRARDDGSAKDREVEAAKARARSAERYGRAG